MIEVDTPKGKRMIPRHKACYAAKVEKHFIKDVGEKTFVKTSDTVYLKDETTGCHLRIGDRKLGKAGKKAFKREKVRLRNSQ